MKARTLIFKVDELSLKDPEFLHKLGDRIQLGMAKADYESSCQGKMKYGHEDTAMLAAEVITRKIGEKLNSYKCRHCEGWHIGHGESEDEQ